MIRYTYGASFTDGPPLYTKATKRVKPRDSPHQGEYPLKSASCREVPKTHGSDMIYKVRNVLPKCDEDVKFWKMLMNEMKKQSGNGKPQAEVKGPTDEKKKTGTKKSQMKKSRSKSGGELSGIPEKLREKKVGNLFQANCYVEFTTLPKITLSTINQQLGSELSSKTVSVMKSMSPQDWETLESLYGLLIRASKMDQLLVCEFALNLVKNLKGQLGAELILDKIHSDQSEAGFLLGKALISVFHGYRQMWGPTGLAIKIRKVLKAPN